MVQEVFTSLLTVSDVLIHIEFEAESGAGINQCLAKIPKYAVGNLTLWCHKKADETQYDSCQQQGNCNDYLKMFHNSQYLKNLLVSGICLVIIFLILIRQLARTFECNVGINEILKLLALTEADSFVIYCLGTGILLVLCGVCIH